MARSKTKPVNPVADEESDEGEPQTARSSPVEPPGFLAVRLAMSGWDRDAYLRVRAAYPKETGPQIIKRLVRAESSRLQHGKKLKAARLPADDDDVSLLER